jgi:NADH-quinone oxidoreductase subunit C
VPTCRKKPAETGQGRTESTRRGFIEVAGGLSTLEVLKTKFPDYIEDSHSFRGDDTAVIKREALRDICTFLRDDQGQQYNLLTDLTCVDFPEREKRLEVVYHLYSLPHNMRIRLKVPVSENSPTVETVSDLWKIANWLEREAWDMFGVVFKGHPDLRRILLYEEFEGHPLRKDYHPLKEQPRVPLRDVRVSKFTQPSEVRPMDGGPEDVGFLDGSREEAGPPRKKTGQ